MKALISLLLLFPLTLVAQNNTHFEIIEHGTNYDLVKVYVGKPILTAVSTPRGEAHIVSLSNGAQVLQKGAPDVSLLATSLILPPQFDGELEIIDAQFIEKSQIDIAPSKGKIYRNEDRNLFNYTYGSWYENNEFYPGKLASLQTPYILRDFRAQALQVFPFQYNPVSKTLRSYTQFTIKVNYTQAASTNLLISNNDFPQAINNEYDQIYKYQFANYKTLGASYTPLHQVGKMLILCDSKYQAAMTDFIEWKERKGYKVFFELSDTITGGATELNLFNRVANYYQQEQITYLLLVGDATDIPAQNSHWTRSDLFGPSDWAYAYQSGNDHYPEFMVGRFSADSLQDAINQVQKTLKYEQQPNTTSSWMQKQVALGSEQGPGDKGQFDHIHLREIADSNANYAAYLPSYEMFDGSHGGNDAVGSPTASELVNAINNGVGLINYCGHGTVHKFSSGGFSGVTDMPSLTNKDGNWPFIFSTACLQGYFIYHTCLAESFLRARSAANEPQGAIAVLMSSINQSWDPPMNGQDEMNAILRHERPTYQTTFGAISSSGIMSTNDHYNSNMDPNGGNEIADTWVIFGDPSVELFTENKGALTAVHNATIALNSNNFTISCAEENALIGLYYQNEFLASGLVQNGQADFTFPALQVLDTIYVTATKQNFSPYYGKIVVTNGIPFGLENMDKENISIYPNPTNNELNIVDKSNSIVAVEIIDLNGKVILKSIDKKLNVSQLASGVYQLKLVLNHKTIITKFSKY